MTKDGKRLGDEHVEPIYDEMAKLFVQSHPYYLPRLLKRMFTLEEAQIAMALPASAEEIAKKMNLDKGYVEKRLDRLMKKGSLFKNEKGEYKRLLLRIHIGDFSCNPVFDEERGEDFFPMLHAWNQDPASPVEQEIATQIQAGGAKPMSRVIPKWKAIKDIPGVMPCEDVRELLKEHDQMSVTRCPCRTINGHHADEGPTCGVDEGEAGWEGNCIKIGRTAKYFAEVMKVAPYLSADYLLKHIEKLEGFPSYHIGSNNRKSYILCNCCTDGCEIKQLAAKTTVFKLQQIVAPSRFCSVADAEKCNGSRVCISKCPFGAIEIEKGKAKVDPDKCMGCGVCVINCPNQALKLKIVRPPEHIPTDTDPLIMERVMLDSFDTALPPKEDGPAGS